MKVTANKEISPASPSLNLDKLYKGCCSRLNLLKSRSALLIRNIYINFAGINLKLKSDLLKWDYSIS
jgi:hypothetical protein